MASVRVAILDECPCTLRPRKARTKFLSRFRLSIVGVFVILLFLVIFCSNYPSKSTYFLRPSPSAMESDTYYTVISAFSSSVSSNFTTIYEIQDHTRFTNHSLSLEMKSGDKERPIQGQTLVANTTRSSENLNSGVSKLEKRNSSDGGEIPVSNSSFHGGQGTVIAGNLSAENPKIGNLSDEGNFSLSYYSTRLTERSSTSSDLKRSCDVFDGKWVKDDAKPYYPPGSCPHVDRDFNCFANGRPDGGFVNWRWKPNGCHLPRLNATDFLERLRGKKLVFVGDSLNRNMWESLVCILRHKVRNKKKVYEISGRTEFKKKGIYAFRFEEYNCSIDFVASPFLVRESARRGKNGTFETLRLDLIDQTSRMYQDADILVFNTGHWWTHEKTSKGEQYYQEGNHVYPKLKALQAYTKALNTWGRWIDDHVDTKKTLVFFRGYSVTHFRGGQWNSGGQCHKESEPIFKEEYLGKYPSKMRAFEGVMQGMKTPVIYLNISRMSDYRKDGHPSIYRRTYATKEEQIAAESYQDCSHWCLPGVPDAWNELLYASLMEAQTRAPSKV